jgi:hypothetical protein
MQSALAIASRFSTLAGSAPISSFFTGSSIFLPDSVRGIAGHLEDGRRARGAPTAPA